MVSSVPLGLACILGSFALLQQATQSPPSNLPERNDRTSMIIAADIDGDGDIDLFCANSTLQANALLLGDGKGHFEDVSAGRLPPNNDSTIGAVFGDVDGDGDADLICANYNASSRLYLNDGRGRFELSSDFPSDRDGDYTVVLFDMDADGDLDAVIGSVKRQTALPGQRKAGMTRLYENMGKGVFEDVTGSNMPMTYRTVTIAVGDINGDGALDMICGSGQGKGKNRITQVYLNDGKGEFIDYTADVLDVNPLGAQSLCLVDLDRDGDLDLVNGPGLDIRQPCRVYKNNGKGIFVEATADFVRAPRGALVVNATDINGDGDVDLFLGRLRLRQYLRNADGRFVERVDWLEDDLIAATFLLVDVNSDGALDLVGGGSGQNWLRFNNGKGLFKRRLVPAGRGR